MKVLPRWRRGLATPPGERQLVAIVVLVALAAYSLAARMRLKGGSPSGDEPAYLLLSRTIAKYHSLDVMRAYTNRDYWSFYPSLLQPHVVPGAHGHLEPLHQIGGPVLWLVPFMLWDRAGAVGFTVVVSILILVNVYYFLRERGIDAPYAFVVTLAMAIGSPIYVLSSMSFVEPIGTLAIVFAVRAILLPHLSGVRLTIASLGVAAAPWVHMRFAPTSLVLGLLLAARVWREHRTTSWWPYVQCLAPLVVSVVLTEVYTVSLYGSVNPMAPQAIYGVHVLDTSLTHGLLGTLYDRNYGLLDNFPLFLLVLPGLLLALRREYVRVNAVLFGVAVPYLVMCCTTSVWWGAYTPPARYVSVVAPLCAFYLGVLLQRVNRWYATGSVVLPGAAGYALAIWSDIFPSERFTHQDLRNYGFERIDHLIRYDVVRFLPSSFLPGQRHLFVAWIGVTVAIGLLFWLAGSWSDLLRLGRRAPAPLAPAAEPATAPPSPATGRP